MNTSLWNAERYRLPKMWFDGFEDDIEWRKYNEDVEGEDDDEELEETPEDVIFMLGFDPLEDSEEES